jgi:hypothetical protein
MERKLINPTGKGEAEMPVNKGFREFNRMTAKIVLHLNSGHYLTFGSHWACSYWSTL